MHFNSRMGKWDHRGIDRLRKGRLSIPGARYFVTIVTEERATGLHLSNLAPKLTDALGILHSGGDIELQCATTMPDHAHALFRLGSRITLSQVLAKWKSLTIQSLQAVGLKWQGNFHDHRLRCDDFMEPFSRYIYLNPYRANLLPPTENWPWWTCSPKYRPEFLEIIHAENAVPASWISAAPGLTDLIEADLHSSRS